MPLEDRPAERFSPERVHELLTARFGGAVSDVERITHGEWSKAFYFRRGSAEYVIRLSPFPDDFLKDQRMMRYASAALPIPPVVEVGEALDGFYGIAERATGDFIETLDDAGLRRLMPSLLSVLDAARLVDLSDTHGFGAWRPDGHAPFSTWREALLDIANDRPTLRVHGWRERLATSPTGDRPFLEAYDRLQSSVAVCPEQRHLIHSDMLYYNVLVADDRVSAVIDWGNAMYGDFLFDLAWFIFWQPWYPAWRNIDFAEEARQHYVSIGLDVPDFEARLRCYQIYIGLDGQTYQAFTRRWSDLEATAQRTIAVP